MSKTSIFYINNRGFLFMILALGLILRLLVLSLFWDTPLTIVDETHYQLIAENILNHGEFSLNTGKPTSIRPPLYPFFLSASYSLMGKINYNGIRIIQVFLSLGIICFICLIGKRIFDEKIGLLAGLIFALYPSFVFFTNFLLTEILFTFLFTVFVWFCLELYYFHNREEKSLSNNQTRAFLAGVLMGLAALTRSILYPFLPIVLILIALFFKCTSLQKVKYAVLFTLGYAMILSPWVIRNFNLYKTPVVIGTMGGLNLYMGNYEHTPLNRAWAAIDITGGKAWYFGHEKTLKNMNSAQKQKWAVSKAKEFILGNKLLTLKRSLIKAANFWGIERSVTAGMINGHWVKLKNKIIPVITMFLIFVSFSLVLIGTVYGIVYNIARYDILFIVILFAYFTGMHSLVFGHSRYHLPLVSLMAVFASWSILNFREIITHRSKLTFKISLIISLLFISIWVREIVFIEGARFFKGL